METCTVCKKNETARLMDGGWGEKKPVCTDCLISGRWRELLPVVEPEPIATTKDVITFDNKYPFTEPTPEPVPEATESTPDVANDLACIICSKPCKSLTGLKSHMRTHK